MERYEEIEKGIETKDIKRLRNALATIIYSSRDFSNGVFDEMVQYVEKQGIVLKDEAFIGEATISSSKDVYTDDDFSRAVYELRENFCDERIEDVKTIGRALYGKKAEPMPEDAVQKEPTEKKPEKKSPAGEKNRPKEESHNPASQIGIVVVIVAIILLLIKLLK